LNDFYIENSTNRGIRNVVHIADLHFGAFDPKKQYEFLKIQYLDRLCNVPYDVMVIDGDIFDHKCMSNSDIALYASLFINDCINECKSKNACLIIVSGTESHDAGQLKLFYHYLGDTSIQLEIVEDIKFVYTHDMKILCIPEKYNMGRNYYLQYLVNSGEYDMCCLHGMVEGAVAGQESTDFDSLKSPLFNIHDFRQCRGPILCGHVHIPGCYQSHIYYSGSPLRWAHGQEQDKGFLFVTMDLDSRKYYTHFSIIESYKYITINFDMMLREDPNIIINKVQEMLNSGIHNLRLEFLKIPNEAEIDHLNIIKNYYRTNPSIKILSEAVNASSYSNSKELENKMNEYSYIFDSNLNQYDIMTRYINQQKGYQYITTEELLQILKGE
jgi:hypothetical protein